MRHTTRLEFPALFKALRAEDKLALIWFHDLMQKGSRPVIKTRRGHMIATNLSYAGLILVVQKSSKGLGKGNEAPAEVRDFLNRGLAFYKYILTQTTAAQLLDQIPDAGELKRRLKN